MTSFATRSEDALKHFLLTAIVVDDRVSSISKENVSVLKTPSRGIKTDIATVSTSGDSQDRGVDGTALVEAFLKEDILCTVLERRSGLEDDEKIPIADIFVLDWMFGDTGGKAVACIKKCTVDHPHAVHLICIYTSEPDISKISKKIKEDFPGVIGIESNNIFKINNTYIVILKKKTFSNIHEGVAPFKEIKEEDLPKELIKIFSALTGGLLSNAVLHALSVIRDNTYTVLSRFPSSLDPAFLSHRVYSNPCEDTEQHIIPLICSEISSILTQEKISEHLNIDAINAWIAADNTPHQNPQALCIERGKNIDNYISNFLINGIKEIEKIPNMPKTIKKSILNIRESTMTSYWGSDTPTKSDVELAMLMSCEYMYSENSPMLKSGTIVSDPNSDYYICIQPPCDCVRIDNKRPFIFAPLISIEDTDYLKNKNFNLACIIKDKIKYFKYVYKPYEIKSITFSPDKHNGNIYTKKYKDKWSFTSLDDKEFIWIMQLKEVHALKIIHEHAVNLSRIGLTESDWLRRCGR